MNGSAVQNILKKSRWRSHESGVMPPPLAVDSPIQAISVYTPGYCSPAWCGRPTSKVSWSTPLLDPVEPWLMIMRFPAGSKRAPAEERPGGVATGESSRQTGIPARQAFPPQWVSRRRCSGRDRTVSKGRSRPPVRRRRRRRPRAVLSAEWAPGECGCPTRSIRRDRRRTTWGPGSPRGPA